MRSTSLLVAFCVLCISLLVHGQVITNQLQFLAQQPQGQSGNAAAGLLDLKMTTNTGIQIQFKAPFTTTVLNYVFKIGPEVTGVVLFPVGVNNLAKTTFTIAGTNNMPQAIINGGPSNVIPLAAPIPTTIILLSTSADGAATVQYTVTFTFSDANTNGSFFQLKTLAFTDPATAAPLKLVPPFDPKVFKYQLHVPTAQTAVMLNFAALNANTVGFLGSSLGGVINTNSMGINPFTPIGNVAQAQIALYPPAQSTFNQVLAIHLQNPIDQPGQTFMLNTIEVVRMADPAVQALVGSFITADVSNCAVSGTCAPPIEGLDSINSAKHAMIVGVSLVGGFILGYIGMVGKGKLLKQ